MKSKTIIAVAEALGLKYLEDIGEAAGIFNGYYLAIRYTGKYHQCSFSLSQMGNHPSKDLMKLIRKDIKAVQSIDLSGYLVNADIKSGWTNKGTIQNMIDGIAELVAHFTENGLVNCSEVNGEEEGVSLYCLNGRSHFFTRPQFDVLRLDADEKRQKDEQRGVVGIILGIFGALVGAFLGAIFIFFIARLGYVSLYGGVIMGFTTVLGYKIFAGRFGLIGIPICLVFMAGMAYFANRLDFAFLLSDAIYEDFNHVIDCFQYMKDIFSANDPQVAASYYRNLYQLWAFTMGTGAIGTIATYFADKKEQPSYPILNESHNVPLAGSYTASPDLSGLSELSGYANSANTEDSENAFTTESYEDASSTNEN